MPRAGVGRVKTEHAPRQCERWDFNPAYGHVVPQISATRTLVQTRKMRHRSLCEIAKSSAVLQIVTYQCNDAI